MNLIEFLVLLAVSLFGAGVSALVVGLARAPVGYEDERGFHLGRPRSDRR